MAELVYVVPPYLLNTCVGLDLQREVAAIDANLAARNVFSPLKQVHFRQPSDIETSKHGFCNDPTVNSMIKEKLRDKFAVLGMLGLSPADEVPDDYLYELYEIFKERLSMAQENGSSNEANMTGNSRNATPDHSTNGLGDAVHKKSAFWSSKLGEVTFGPLFLGNINSCLSNYSLEALINWAKESSEHKYSFFPSLMVGQQSFLSPLPMYWTPLSVDKHLEHLEKNLAMEIDTSTGYSLLKFKLQRDRLPLEDLYRKKRYFNFLANNDVQEKCGIYYYEVLVDQIATAASDYKPLICLNDSLLAAGSSLLFTLGYTKRKVRFDKMPTNTTTGINHQSLDLKDVQSKISYYNQNVYNRRIDDDTLTFLGAEPGVSFEGSFAVNFNNTCSYASIKHGDSTYRTSSLNTNRRFSQFNRQTPADQDTSKIDVEVPFSVHSSSNDRVKKRYKTDIVGCGVNFINKTLFITLNGIIVKEITAKEMIESNRHKDSIFEHDMKMGSLFPMIGFQLSELPKELAEGELPETVVRTNFGLKEFEFNINRYVQKFTEMQAEELSSKLVEEGQSGPDLTFANDHSFEKAVSDIRNDPEVLNEFIKGYLIQHGYLETLQAFNSDIQDLTSHTRDDVPMEMNGQQDTLVEESHAVERQKIRKMINEHYFLQAAEFLAQTYPNLKSLDQFLFDLRFQHYVSLVKKYLNLKYGHEFNFSSGEMSEEELLKAIVKYGEMLSKLASGNAAVEARIAKFSGVVLIQNREQLSEMPLAQKQLDSQDNEVEKLAGRLNAAILELLNFEKVSKLEHLIQSAGNNINSLCAENDNTYKLVNYEHQYIDI